VFCSSLPIDFTEINRVTPAGSQDKDLTENKSNMAGVDVLEHVIPELLQAFMKPRWNILKAVQVLVHLLSDGECGAFRGISSNLTQLLQNQSRPTTRY
jgi:hypothetical protein